MTGKDDQLKNVTTVETMNIGDVKLSSKNTVSQELVDVLYTKEEVALLNEGVSPHEIHALNELFGREYIMTEYKNIVERLRACNELLKRIGDHDDKHRSPYDKVIVTGGFMDEPYNKQRKYHGRDMYPNKSKMTNELLVDLFSQGYQDLLKFKDIATEELSRESDRIEEHGNDYIFSPKTMIYVDVFNRNKELIHERGIHQLYVQDDSLRFLALLPDNCSNYVLSGFDDYVIKSYIDLGKEYVDSLIKEIDRTIKKGGVIAGINFERNDLLEARGLKDITPPKYDPFGKKEKERSSSDFYVYEKE